MQAVFGAKGANESLGAFEGANYFDHERYQQRWRVGLRAQLGWGWSTCCVPYIIGGVVAAPFRVDQALQSTTDLSPTCCFEKLWRAGTEVGLGCGLSISEHWQLRLESTATWFSKIQTVDIHDGASDMQVAAPRQLLSSLELIYKF